MLKAALLPMIDREKRKRVMARSMKLGHCICDPKKPCPCDVFREHDVCPCAGERLDIQQGPIRLTELVARPGCASKIDAGALAKALAGLETVSDPNVLIGMAAGDDAGVYQLNETTALVQTVDVFSPSVDDPYLFGRIAASNSVSDVYAMGGRPITALSIVGFPIRSVPDEHLRAILQGGIDTMREADTPVVGGHSINEEEIKAGFAVTGLIDPRKIASKDKLQPGDRLILTKPLGTGLIAFASQIGRAPSGSMETAGESMATLNRRAAELMNEFGVNACTDVTGFGLMGHLGTMAAASRIDVEVLWDDLPRLPGVDQCLVDGIIPGAVERNRESTEQYMVADGALSREMLELCFDAQTSGGLLMAVNEKDAERFLARLRDEGVEQATMIGAVRESDRSASEEPAGRVFVETNGSRQMPTPRPRPKREAESEPPVPVTSIPSKGTKDMSNDENKPCCCGSEEPTPQPVKAEECCGGAASSDCCSSGGSGGSSDSSASVDETESKFFEFMKATNAPGTLDARTKKAIAIALSVAAKCEPCLKNHILGARDVGFSQEEIDEAAWMAIAFGGSPLMMFYKTLRRTA
jgi:selenide, water dikinase